MYINLQLKIVWKVLRDKLTHCWLFIGFFLISKIKQVIVSSVLYCLFKITWYVFHLLNIVILCVHFVILLLHLHTLTPSAYVCSGEEVPLLVLPKHFTLFNLFPEFKGLFLFVCFYIEVFF